MANVLLSLDIDCDMRPVEAIVRMVARGFDGKNAPQPPEKLLALSEAKMTGGTLCMHGAPSADLLRWLADIVEANPSLR